MRIFVCPVDRRYQPERQGFVWPPRNSAPGWDFGVEQDFLRWLDAHPDLQTNDPAAADWGYIPIYYNRMYINNNDEDGHWGGSQEFRSDLAATVDALKRKYNGLRLFTVCEYDLVVLSPYLDLRGITVFCASRRQPGTGIDIPLLAAPHPRFDVPKRHLAVFQGHMQTDGCRIRMGEVLTGRADCLIEHTNKGPDEFAKTLCASYLALAPRGQGVQSFRFYEALQLGIPPIYLTDDDARPFQKWLDWDECSFLCQDVTALPALLDDLAADLPLLLEMGKRAADMYQRQIGYGRWCSYVLRELERL